ncbi:MAG: hypothetical protein U9N56_02220 [Actinomycetota bacterium]|nr:hypothetical protein [Actinomycetota bacterium]
MAHSRRFKIVTGTVSVAMALGVGTAIASDDGASTDDIDLDEVVGIHEVAPAVFAPTDFVFNAQDLDGDDSLASPFDSVDDSVDSQDSPDSPDDSPDDSPESPDDSPDDSPESPDDSPDDTPDSPDDSPDSPDDSPDSNDSP